MADNNANRQIGILVALRETCRVFKDHLTKISSNEYDPNLLLADSDFRNDPYRWMLPCGRDQVPQRRQTSARLRRGLACQSADVAGTQPAQRRTGAA